MEKEGLGGLGGRGGCELGPGRVEQKEPDKRISKMCVENIILRKKSPLTKSLRLSVEPVHPKIRSSKSYVIWYEKQPFTSKIGDNLTTMKGRKVTIICAAEGIPRPSITWYRAGEKMSTNARHVTRGEKLIMYNLDVLDTDRYTCVAKNFVGMASATTTLKVYGMWRCDLLYVRKTMLMTSVRPGMQRNDL